MDEKVIAPVLVQPNLVIGHWPPSDWLLSWCSQSLVIVFTSDCKWDAHIAGMIEKATASINALQTFFQNRHVSFEVKRAMLLALIRPRVEYGSEVWWATSQQTNTIESKIQIEVLKRSLHCKPNICHEVLRAEAGVRPLSSWLDQRKVEWWFKLQQKDTTSLSRQALEASWPSHRNYTSWQKRFNKLRAELGGNLTSKSERGTPT